MGVRGTLPTPTKIRILNGNPSRRPLPANEPQFTPGVPDRPSGMSAGARKQWDALVGEMANSGVLRRVDGGALAMLCEDLAMLDTLRKGLAALASEITRKAKEKKQQISGNALQDRPPNQKDVVCKMTPTRRGEAEVLQLPRLATELSCCLQDERNWSR